MEEGSLPPTFDHRCAGLFCAAARRRRQNLPGDDGRPSPAPSSPVREAVRPAAALSVH